LLCVSLLPCCRYHPAEVNNRVGQFAVIHAVFTPRLRVRPSGQSLSGPPMRLLSLRPGNSLSSLKMIVSMGFRISVSLYSAIRTTWLLTLTMAGLSPAEHTSFHWTHNRTGRFPDIRLKPFESCHRQPAPTTSNIWKLRRLYNTHLQPSCVTAGECTCSDLHSFAFPPMKVL
jgi:hypothetical protein